MESHENEQFWRPTVTKPSPPLLLSPPAWGHQILSSQLAVGRSSCQPPGPVVMYWWPVAAKPGLKPALSGRPSSKEKAVPRGICSEVGFRVSLPTSCETPEIR